MKYKRRIRDINYLMNVRVYVRCFIIIFFVVFELYMFFSVINIGILFNVIDGFKENGLVD